MSGTFRPIERFLAASYLAPLNDSIAGEVSGFNQLACVSACGFAAVSPHLFSMFPAKGPLPSGSVLSNAGYSDFKADWQEMRSAAPRLG